MALENILPGYRRRRYPNAPPAPPGTRNRVRHTWLNQHKGRLRMTEPAFRNARISRLGLLLHPVHLQVDSRRHLLQLFEAGFGLLSVGFVFFFNDASPTEIYTLSRHHALPRPGRVL